MEINPSTSTPEDLVNSKNLLNTLSKNDKSTQITDNYLINILKNFRLYQKKEILNELLVFNDFDITQPIVRKYTYLLTDIIEYIETSGISKNNKEKIISLITNIIILVGSRNCQDAIILSIAKELEEKNKI